MEPVDPGQTVAELLEQRPHVLWVFLRRRMACPGCAMAPFETVAEVAQVYRIPLEPFLRELREAADVHGDLPGR